MIHGIAAKIKSKKPLLYATFDQYLDGLVIPAMRFSFHSKEISPFMTHCSRTAAQLLMIALLICGAASAQSTFGTILGTVKDNSGAIVPNATVTIINTDDNVTRT